jgi:hypothetical protein
MNLYYIRLSIFQLESNPESKTQRCCYLPPSMCCGLIGSSACNPVTGMSTRMYINLDAPTADQRKWLLFQPMDDMARKSGSSGDIPSFCDLFRHHRQQADKSQCRIVSLEAQHQHRQTPGIIFSNITKRLCLISRYVSGASKSHLFPLILSNRVILGQEI